MEWKCVWRVLGGWFHGPDIVHLQPHRRESAQTSVNRCSNLVFHCPLMVGDNHVTVGSDKLN